MAAGQKAKVSTTAAHSVQPHKLGQTCMARSCQPSQCQQQREGMLASFSPSPTCMMNSSCTALAPAATPVHGGQPQRSAAATAASPERLLQQSAAAAVVTRRHSSSSSSRARAVWLFDVCMSHIQQQSLTVSNCCRCVWLQDQGCERQWPQGHSALQRHLSLLPAPAGAPLLCQ